MYFTYFVVTIVEYGESGCVMGQTSDQGYQTIIDAIILRFNEAVMNENMKSKQCF